jgi:cellulose synthase/poly-beta-1,6-N-acetylglucosamine synthase-like glycosyltransferase
MGRRLGEVVREDRLYLEEVADSRVGVKVRDAAYLITLDADSLLLPEYANRLIHVLESPGSERVGVIQTPYSAVPNPSSQLERVAGAQTDIQFFNHQGMTYYGAAFWVGASAVLRKVALEAIVMSEEYHGYEIKKYIRDQTLVEDTESTVDLIPTGWTVYSYPERLSYSATPPDFGALLVQRGRWANGGLLVIPKLLRYVFAQPRCWLKFREGMFRFYYVFSLAAVSIGFLLTVAWPYGTDASISSWWVIPAALPYYILYARDLKLAGCQAKGEFFRVYALNLLLVPINIAGTLKSLYQMWTGKRSTFKRTPKVLERTSVPVQHLVFEYGLLAWLAFGTAWNVVKHHWLDATFACINALFLSYAIWRFIGFRETLSDLKISLTGPQWNLSGLSRGKVARDECNATQPQGTQ